MIGDALSNQIDALFRKWNLPDSPGCAVGILKDGEFVYERYFGQANLEWEIPIQPTTRFLIASMTKQFTAAAIHLLAERGDLNLDEEFQRYLQEFPNYREPVTIRHLLHHTSGMREQGVLWLLCGKSMCDLDNPNLLKLLSRQTDLNFPPGSAVAYSNSGYTLLAEIIQRVSGISYGQFIQENIFAPLGMVSSWVDEDASTIVKQRASSYSPKAEGSFSQHAKVYNMVGADGILTTLHDLARWDANFYQPKIGGPDFITNMLKPGQLRNGQEIHFASGLSLAQYRGIPIVRHGGMMLGFRSQMIRFPRQHFTVMILANVNPFNPTRLIEQIADLCLAEYFTQPADSLNMGQQVVEAQIEDQLGLYVDPEGGASYRLFMRGGLLWLEVMGNALPVAPLMGKPCIGDEVYYRSYDGPPLTFDLHLRRTPGQPYHLYIQAEMHELPVGIHCEAQTLSDAEMDACSGEYVSPDLNVVYRFERIPGGLRGGVEGGLFGDLQPGPSGKFILNDTLIEFKFDRSDQVSGMVLMSARARRLNFTRTRA
jgi:CubicO group peptidase (beta-lactamase class C family)